MKKHATDCHLLNVDLKKKQHLLQLIRHKKTSLPSNADELRSRNLESYF